MPTSFGSLDHAVGLSRGAHARHRSASSKNPMPRPLTFATGPLEAATKLLVVALLAGGVAACSDEPTASSTKIPSRPALTTGTGSAITVTPTSVQFDSTVVGTFSYGGEFKVTNTGTTELALSTVKSSGPASDDFNRVASKDLPACQYGTNAAKLAPGASCGAFLTFTPGDSGLRTGAWTFVAANGDTAKLELSGTGVRRDGTLSTTPDPLDFGPQLVGITSSARKIIVTNTGNENIVVSTIKATGVDAWEFTPVDVGSSSLCADKPYLDPGASCDAFVTFKPGITGPASAWLTIRTDKGAIATPLTGTGVTSAPVLSVTPSSVMFTSQVVGTSSTAQKVIVTNTGKENLLLSTTTFGGTNAKEFKLSPYSNNLCQLNIGITPGSSCELLVQFTPLAEGTRTASLDIDSDGGKASVTLSGNAVPPVPMLYVATTSLGFGTQDVGSISAPQAVTISNTGTGPLTLSYLSLTGANWSDFAIAGIANLTTNQGGGPCTYPMAIAPGSNCIAQISFMPSATGTRSASLNIQTDGGTASVPLAGTGVLPPADVAVSVGATPSTATAGKPLTYTMTVRNSGPASAEGVKLLDVVPSTTTFVSITAPPEFVCVTPAVGGTGTVSCTVSGAMASNTTRTVTLVVKVLSGGRNSISNTASVTSKSPDPAGMNNSATINTTVYGRR